MSGPMGEAERDRQVIALLAPYVVATDSNEDELDRELVALDKEPDPEVTRARVAQILAVPNNVDSLLAAERSMRLEARS